MKIFGSFIALFVTFGVIDLVMRRFAAWRKAKKPATPYYAGPTPAEHERNLKKAIGQFVDAHAAAAWGNRVLGQFEKTGKVSKWNSNPFKDDDVITDPAYSSLGSNIFHDNGGRDG